MSVIFHAINCIPRFAPETAFWCVSFVLTTRTSLWTFVSLCHCVLCTDVCVTVSYVWTYASLCPMYGRMCHCVLCMDVCVTVSYVWTYVSLYPMYGRMCHCVLRMDVCVTVSYLWAFVFVYVRAHVGQGPQRQPAGSAGHLFCRPGLGDSPGAYHGDPQTKYGAQPSLNSLIH